MDDVNILSEQDVVTFTLTQSLSSTGMYGNLANTKRVKISLQSVKSCVIIKPDVLP